MAADIEKSRDPFIAAAHARAQEALRDAKRRMDDVLEREEHAVRIVLKSADLVMKSREQVDRSFDHLANRHLKNLYGR